MQLRFYKNVLPASDSLTSVSSICWAGNKWVLLPLLYARKFSLKHRSNGFPLFLRCSGRFAAVTAERVVFLFDDTGERKDKFKTKPADAATQPNYTVRDMAWSPDSSKLAIAQSDNIVFVYRCLYFAFMGAAYSTWLSVSFEPRGCMKYPSATPPSLRMCSLAGSARAGPTRSRSATNSFRTRL